ncbi:hypothetical protein BFC19_12145 (plasmid) [Brochothrix thermosphacta]|uniref:hypothetical protein n=1 Tax=Brochothrix thermosphacta TaxID=2756 RepID=UPI000E73A6CB|nr:hypothetical protein [Brochothrix thermosphacta]ANZ96192.1 hypothetical protein BFC19_12145 [Brochothrix thermosphacta]
MEKEVIGFNRLDEHVVFKTKKEMNYAVADHLKNNAAFLRDNSKEILTYIAKIASHYNGACGVLYKTIADRLGVTKRTVERCMSELKKYNIVEVVKQYSKRGGRMSSVIRILPFDTQKNNSVGQPVGNEMVIEQDEKPSDSKVKPASQKNTNLSNPLLKSLKQGTEVSNLLYIFDDFRNKGLSRPKFEEIVEEAIPIAINLKAYVRKTCENYVKNKQSIAGTLKNKALEILQRIQKLGSSFNNGSQNTTSNAIIVNTMPSDYYGKIEDAPY